MPETHIPIASNKDAIKQFINVCTLGSFDVRTIQAVAILFLVLSYTPAAHSYLLSYGTIETMNKAEYTDENDDNQGLFLETSGTPLLFKLVLTLIID